MNSSNERPSRTLATLVAALGISVGVVPATLHAQTAVASPEAVQQKGAAAVQKKVDVDKATLPVAKDAIQKKVKVEPRAPEAVQSKGVVSAPKAATPDR
jgi:hypothetical protein